MTTDFREQLAALADAPDAPPSTVDVALAVRAGRRRLLRKRAGAGAGAAAVAVVTAVAVLTAGTGRTTTPVVPGPSAPPAPSTVLPATDPLTAVVSFGWLPQGFAASAHLPNGAQAQPTSRGTGTTPHFSVFLTAGDPTADQLPVGAMTSAKLRKIPVGVNGDADGHWWSAGPADPEIDGTAWLTWRIDARNWATLAGYELQALPGWQQTMPEIAAGIRMSTAPVPLPFHIEGLPRSLTLVAASYQETLPASGGIPWSAGLEYTADGNEVEILAQPATGPWPYDDPSRPDSSTCVTRQGLYLCVVTPSGIPAALAAIGGPRGLLNRMTSLGPDPRDWTTKVVVTSP